MVKPSSFLCLVYGLIVVSSCLAGVRTPPCVISPVYGLILEGIVLKSVRTPPSVLSPVYGRFMVIDTVCVSHLTVPCVSCPHGAVLFGFPPPICRQCLHAGKRIGEASNPGPPQESTHVYDAGSEGSSDDCHEESQSTFGSFRVGAPLSVSSSIAKNYNYKPTVPEPPDKPRLGRPMKVMSPDDPQFQRRQKYRALQNNPALKRPFPGRPKSHNPKYPVRAESKRVAPVKKKVVHLVKQHLRKPTKSNNRTLTRGTKLSSKLLSIPFFKLYAKSERQGRVPE